ncbi:uncharacterized protein ARMOST_07920 [Armillaria ostoyae]|uniref:Uncharacterized protein n=1 Tax=Armillaria ostoyae TaxID=47428 RepID=A0A284R757_ARMOS|nr:uncharacterized protein ARMOST_07920 [Armillaria ostoyae]
MGSEFTSSRWDRGRFFIVRKFHMLKDLRSSYDRSLSQDWMTPIRHARARTLTVTSTYARQQAKKVQPQHRVTHALIARLETCSPSLECPPRHSTEYFARKADQRWTDLIYAGDDRPQLYGDCYSRTRLSIVFVSIELPSHLHVGGPFAFRKPSSPTRKEYRGRRFGRWREDAGIIHRQDSHLPCHAKVTLSTFPFSVNLAKRCLSCIHHTPHYFYAELPRLCGLSWYY